MGEIEDIVRNAITGAVTTMHKASGGVLGEGEFAEGEGISKNVRVGGYIRRTKSGRLIHVSGYTREGMANLTDSFLERQVARGHMPNVNAVSEKDIEGRNLEEVAFVRPPKGGNPTGVTSVKPGETKSFGSVEVSRTEPIPARGRLRAMGSTYSFKTDTIGQVRFGMKQAQAQLELNYLISIDGGAKSDPEYTWQKKFKIGDVLEDGSKVKGWYRNTLITTKDHWNVGLGDEPKKKKKKK